MQFGYINDLLADPRGTLIFLLLAFPGRMLAISVHEAAHAWMANRCGDPTARLMGRMTLNPLKHLDPVGLIMMVVVGIGWAKPVPVNPLHYRNYRRDDLKVSLAGITMNLICFLLGGVLMYALLAIALACVPQATFATAKTELFRTHYQGVSALVSGEYWYSISELFRYGLYGSLGSEALIAPVFGTVAGYLFQMLSYFTMTNLVLAVFNLIPLPPLDGYHVLNDLFIRRPLFATQRSAAIASAILYVGALSGVLSEVLGRVYEFVYTGVGAAAAALLSRLGLF